MNLIQMYLGRKSTKQPEIGQETRQSQGGHRSYVAPSPVQKQLPAWHAKREQDSNAALLGSVSQIIEGAQRRTSEWAREIKLSHLTSPMPPMPQRLFPSGPLHF